MRQAAAGMTLRTATAGDIPRLEALIAESVRGLQREDYTAEQIEGALGTIYGTDRRMIADGTFFIVEHCGEVAGCGGWSKRRTAFGSDSSPVKDDSCLDPAVEPAKIRGFFVHPAYARKGIGSRILKACEEAAAAAGFSAFELTSTLTGVALYRRHGYVETERLIFTLPNGVPYVAVRMRRETAAARSASAWQSPAG
jgi:GNAT superfamily N-acetyltransferase